jgi:hypothetical protein
LPGLIAVLQSKTYMHQISLDPYGGKYSDLPARDSLSELGSLKDHLNDEIKWLRQAAALATANEKAEIGANIRIAEERLNQLRTVGPYELSLLVEKDPDYVLLQSLLPYHVKHFEPNFWAQSEAYQNVGASIARLKAERRLP